MSVSDRKVVDLLSTDQEGTRATLTVSDHLEWTADNQHLLILQEKLNDYMAFIESGEIYELYPEMHGLEIGIDVVCMHPPAGDGIRFLELAGKTIEEDRATNGNIAPALYHLLPPWPFFDVLSRPNFCRCIIIICARTINSKRYENKARTMRSR